MTLIPPAPAGMTDRFGLLVSVLGLRGGIDKIRIEPGAVDTLREAAAQGPLLYVLPHRSSLDHLALNAVLLGHGLPLAVWAPHLATFWIRPLRDAWVSLRAWIRGGPHEDPLVPARALAAGRPIVLFADDHVAEGDLDPFGVLVAAALLEPPARLVPLMVAWDRRPEVDDPVRSFFAGAAVPGVLRRWWRAVSGADVRMQVGHPVDLSRVAERVGVRRLPAVMRRVMSRALRTEDKLVRGPRLLPHRTMRRLVLDNPPMRALAAHEAEARGTTVDRVRRQMDRELDKIAARFSWTIIRLLHLILRPLWTRVFSGVDVPPADIERIRAAMRHGTAVLVPCHKSHFDYVLLSWVLYDHGIIVPHVVAGRNLAVWPVSVLLRGAGGFFVPRTFVGLDPVVQAVFARYLRELVLQEYPVEFFIEGGRSRSGKLQPPKLGVLGMVLDAAELRPHGREVTLLPIGLAYEQVAEEKAYARELGGEPKRPESLGQLAKSRSVLRRRFGRVHLRVATPIPCGPLVDPHPGFPAWSSRPDDERRRLLQALGAQVVAGMGRATVVLPTSLAALALLAHHRRAIRADELWERVQRFDRLLIAAGLPRAASLERLDVAIGQALDRFASAGRIRSVGEGEERVWDVDPDHRITLDFYKNQVLHALAPALLASAVLRAAPDNAGAPSDLAPRFAWLVTRLRREFVFDPDAPAAELLAAGLGQLAFHGAAVEEGGRWRVTDRARIAEMHGLVRPLLEAHLAVIEAGPALPLAKDQIPAAVLSRRGALSASGVVTRPESLSVVTLKNVVAVLQEDGVLVARDGRLDLDGDAARGHVTEMNAMVGR